MKKPIGIMTGMKRASRGQTKQSKKHKKVFVDNFNFPLYNILSD